MEMISVDSSRLEFDRLFFDVSLLHKFIWKKEKIPLVWYWFATYKV